MREAASVGARGQERPVGLAVQNSRELAAARRYRALRAAVGDHGHFRIAVLDGGLRVREVRHERRPADYRAVVIARLDAQVLAQLQDRHARLGMRRENGVDIGGLQPAIVERPQRRLHHQVGRAHVGRYESQVGFGGADHRHTASLAAHRDPSTAVNTG
jgi:hypothetical protein